jgi:hypothetical protein
VTGDALPLSVGHLGPRIGEAFVGVERLAGRIGALASEVSDGDGGIAEDHDLHVEVVDARVLRRFGLRMSLRDTGARLPYFEAGVLFPLVAMIVGSLIGLLARKNALLAAILVFATCLVYALLKTGRVHEGLSWWLILIALVSIYLGLGISAAICMSRVMNRSVARSS